MPVRRAWGNRALSRPGRRLSGRSGVHRFGMVGLIAALVGSGLTCDVVSGGMADLAAESASHVSLARESLRGTASCS